MVGRIARVSFCAAFCLFCLFMWSNANILQRGGLVAVLLLMLKLGAVLKRRKKISTVSDSEISD
jgi:hypothetical protein